MVLDRPCGFQEVDAPKFQDICHVKMVRLSALCTSCSYPPRKYTWYSFLFGAELTTEPLCSWKDYVNEKFQ